MKAKSPFLLYGIVGGLITVIGFFLWPVLVDPESESGMKYGELIGYAFMLLALSTVFFALRSFRDRNGGLLTFKEGFLNGLIVVVVASVIYVIGWMIYYPIFMPEFADQYTQSQITQLETQGLSDTELQQRVEELKAFQEMYEQPLVMAGFSFLEIFPVGLIVSLISALILRRTTKDEAIP